MGEKDHQLVFGQVRQLQGDIRRQGIHILAQSPRRIVKKGSVLGGINMQIIEATGMDGLLGDSVQREITEEHPYLQPPKDSHPMCI